MDWTLILLILLLEIWSKNKKLELNSHIIKIKTSQLTKTKKQRSLLAKKSPSGFDIYIDKILIVIKNHFDD